MRIIFSYNNTGVHFKRTTIGISKTQIQSQFVDRCLFVENRINNDKSFIFSIVNYPKKELGIFKNASYISVEFTNFCKHYMVCLTLRYSILCFVRKVSNSIYFI